MPPVQQSFASPWAAAGNAIFDYLSQREAKKQQDFVNSMATERENRLAAADAARLSVEQENLKLTQELRQQGADAAALKNAEAVKATYRPGQQVSPEGVQALAPLPGLVEDLGSNLPSTQRALMSTLPMGPQPDQTPVAPGVIGGTVTQSRSGSVFRGDPQQQAMERIRATLPPQVADLVDAGVLKGDALEKMLTTAPGGDGHPLMRVNPQKGGLEYMNKSGSYVPFAGDLTDAYMLPKGTEMLQQAQPPANLMVQAPSGDALDMLASMFLQNPQSVQSRNPVLYKAITDRAAQMSNAAGGINPVANATELAGDKTALQTLQRQQAQVGAFANTARQNIKVLKDTMQGLPDTGSSLLNQPWRKVQTMTGSTQLAKFNAALGTVQPEITRVLQSANATGVNTVHAQAEVEKILDPNATVGQVLAALDVLEKDMANRQTEIAAAIAQVQGNVQSRDPLHKQTAAPAAPAPAAPTETPEQRRKRLYDELTAGMK